jgi:hypothetical protein
MADRLSHVKTRLSVPLAVVLSTAVLSAQPQNPANSSAAPARGTALASPAPGAEAGRPFIRRYTPKEYGAGEQNWAFAQDDRGVTYVGNNLGE